jgi:ATP-dependent DNA helicase RecG
MARSESPSPADPLTRLPGVGAKRADRLALLGLSTVEDLLRFAPRAYEDRGAPVPIADVPGRELAVVRGRIVKHWMRRGRGGRPVLTATVEDDSGRLKALWFHAGYLARDLAPGTAVALAGRVSRDASLIQPEIERLDDPADPVPARLTGIRPLYSLTEGVTQRLLTGLVGAALPAADALEDPLPPEAREAAGVAPLAEAIRLAHCPATLDDAAAGRERLMLDLLVPIELEMRRRREARLAARAPRPAGSGGGADDLLEALPFRLSPSQERAVDDVVADLAGIRPMARMLVGDVGTGKTAVALAAMEEARSLGFQCAFLAPTDLLARQHFRQAEALLPRGADGVVLLTGTRGGAAAEEARRRLAAGDADVAIGTHALFSEATRFSRLGLVIIDEQHRFGVAQRRRLLEKADTPHCLVLTATPIPRSLALLAFGDTDLTALEPRPGARGPVVTRVPPAGKRADALRFVRERLEAGEQAFFVRPRIDGDETGALSLREELARGALAGLGVGIVHGRQPPAERDAALEALRAGELSALVATSVVEVGLDVPGASILWVEEAERFGLSQLHQLRGRIARRGQKGYCLLWEGRDAPESSRDRLSALVDTDDGLRLAELDLATRGPGELLGLKQSGRYGVFAAPGRDGRGDLGSLADRAGRAAGVLADLAKEEACELPSSSSP